MEQITDLSLSSDSILKREVITAGRLPLLVRDHDLPVNRGIGSISRRENKTANQ